VGTVRPTSTQEASATDLKRIIRSRL
jgi:hypothetical protein